MWRSAKKKIFFFQNLPHALLQNKLPNSPEPPWCLMFNARHENTNDSGKLWSTRPHTHTHPFKSTELSHISHPPADKPT